MLTEIPIRNIYYLLSYAFDYLGRAEPLFISNDTFKSSEDLIVKLLEIPLTSIHKLGFKKDYYQNSEVLRGVKGKLNFSESVKKNLFVTGNAICEYDEMSFDIIPNQILKTTILNLQKSGQVSKENQQILKRYAAILRDIKPIKLTKRSFDSIKGTRLNPHYKFALHICFLYFESLSLSNGEGSLKSAAFFDNEKKMHRLFERFVLKFYEKHLPECSVSSKIFKWEIDSSDFDFLERVPDLRSDIVIRAPAAKVIIDTKFYKEALTKYWDTSKFSRDHLSQLMDYMRVSMRIDPILTSGLLLYPTNGVHLNNSGRIEGFDIRISTIDLSKSWDLIESELLSFVKPALKLDQTAA